MTDFSYYYNNVPNEGLCRNNLIYTSLISKDKTVFCQWYHNDTEYHRGKNQVVDPLLMEDKWNREIKFLLLMTSNFPDMVPNILDIDYKQRKLYIRIDGVDFWQKHLDLGCKYDDILPNWKEQMLAIFKAHHSLSIWKYSLHPSSYFIVDGKLKSINYFFCYDQLDLPISLKEVLSHISLKRQQDLFPKMEKMGLIIDKPTPFVDLQLLTFESFKTNFPNDFMDKAKSIYV